MQSSQSIIGRFAILRAFMFQSVFVVYCTYPSASSSSDTVSLASLNEWLLRCEWEHMNRNDVFFGNRLAVSACEIQHKEGNFLVHRLGPFRLESSSTGTERNANLYNNTHHRGYAATWQVWTERRNWSIVGSGAWAVDASDPKRIIGHPGLYYHHVHMFAAEDKATLSEEFILPGPDQQKCPYRLRQLALLHGDGICASDAGGMGCAYTDWLPYSLSSNSTQLFFDVYVTHQDSQFRANQSFFMYVVLRHRTPAEGAVRPMYYFNAMITGNVRELFGVYTIREAFSMTFTESVAPVSGRLLFSSTHSHLSYMVDMFLIAMPASKLNLQYRSFRERFMNRGTLPFRSIHDMYQERRRLLNATWQEGQSLLVCATTNAALRFETIRGVRYERLTAPQCREWRFRKGDPFVVVAFNALDANEEEYHIPQHSLFRIYAESYSVEDPPISLMYQATCPPPRGALSIEPQLSIR